MNKDKTKPHKRPPLVITDERFVHALNDPVFRRLPKNEKRINIDKRFQSMFHDKQFKLKYSVDKRGRPVNLSTNEDLQQYYNLVEDDDKPEEEDDALVNDNKHCDPSLQIKSKNKSSGESDSDVDGNDVKGNLAEDDIGKLDPSATKLSKSVKKKIRDNSVDYARGEGLFADEESSEDSSSTADEDDNEDTTHAWGELDHDAETTEEATKRLALCNMDWDRLKAVDLMVLFHSFLPPGGVLRAIDIYTSEYGKERLADEEVHGPMELRVAKPNSEEKVSDDEVETTNENGDEDEEGGGYQMEKLRQYQLNRLKYFYAVLEFDSVATAEKIYTECDRMEYESSATRVDLRYIPDDMEFDDEPKDSCDALPQAEKYRPRFFTTTALQQAKVCLTWDETDPLRKELTQKIHDPKEKIDDEDLKAYLASSESEDDIEDLGNEGSETASVVDPVAKYRALLESIETHEKKKKDKDVEMEITWGVGLKEKAASLVKKRLEEKTASNFTPWEEILEKKKEKRKLKKKTKLEDEKTDDKESGGDEEKQLFSDDDVDIDMNDPFFKDEIESNEIMKNTSKKNKKKDLSSGKLDTTRTAVDNALLELLLMDETDNKQHFSLKKIMQAENEGKKKKRNRKAKMTTANSASESTDTFQVDMQDSRFSALFSSHLYNLDPSDPNFKKTKGMEAIIHEKQKRRIDQVESEDPKTTSMNVSPNSKILKKTELSCLVKSVKRNAEILKKKIKKSK